MEKKESELLKKIKELRSIDVEQELVRLDLGQEFNFSSQKDNFHYIIEQLGSLQYHQIEIIPKSILKNTVMGIVGETEAMISAVKNFKIGNSSNVNSEFSSIRNQIEAIKNKIFTEIFPIISSLNVYQSINDTESKSLSDEFEDIAKSARESLDEIKAIKEASRKAVSEIGVGAYEAIFQTESKNNENTARQWLWASAVICLAILSVGLWFYNAVGVTDNTQNNQAQNLILIKEFFVKILILTTLFYALNFCSKNYKAYKHNAIINKHRENALKTFQTFIKSAGDDEQTKNAILLEVTRTIFSNQNTGYNPGENDAEAPAKIIEIIKSAK